MTTSTQGMRALAVVVSQGNIQRHFSFSPQKKLNPNDEPS